MPNTLGHLGVQALLTRSLIKRADLIWIYIGIIIPDLPWITQRLIQTFVPGIDLYDLRLYCVIQASLFFSLILSAAFAFASSNFKKVFIILSISSLMHLILDSLETKWGNGIQLFVPFDWKILNFGLFWPESFPIYLITIFGLIYILVKWKDALTPSLTVSWKFKKVIYSTAFLLVYFLMPIIFINNAEAADNHSVKTLRNYDLHTGKYFEMDRGNYIDLPNGDLVITPFKKEYKVIGLNLNKSTLISIKAKFLSKDEIQIINYHLHIEILRDLPAYLGLLLIGLLILLSNEKLLKRRKRVDQL